MRLSFNVSIPHACSWQVKGLAQQELACSDFLLKPDLVAVKLDQCSFLSCIRAETGAFPSINCSFHKYDVNFDCINMRNNPSF